MRVGGQALEQGCCEQSIVSRWRQHWHYWGCAHGVRGGQGPPRREPPRCCFHEEQPRQTTEEPDVHARGIRGGCRARQLAREIGSICPSAFGYTQRRGACRRSERGGGVLEADSCRRSYA